MDITSGEFSSSIERLLWSVGFFVWELASSYTEYKETASNKTQK